MLEIKEVQSSQVKVYKQLILKGLIEDEDCFRVAPEDEEMEPFPTKNQIDSFTMGAFIGNTLIGAIPMILKSMEQVPKKEMTQRLIFLLQSSKKVDPRLMTLLKI